VAPVTILGFIAALIPPLAPLLVSVAKIPAGLITKVAYRAADFPVINLRNAFLLIAFIAALYFGRKYLFILIPIILILSFLQRWPNNDWQIANCDVGQGDALVLKSAPHSGVVIDVGPEPRLIDQCLKALSINEIPLLILTHPHADHVGGLVGATNGRKVGRIIQNAMRGEILKLGEMRIEFLWPDNGSHYFTDNGGEGSEINNQSIVALITTNDYSLLTTGDLEPDAQSLISPPKVDYLKVAHHGSKYQDNRFNKAANPELAIISVGVGNKYGHPAAQTIKLFKKVVRTDKAGAIAIDPNTGSVSSSKVGAFGLPVLWRVA
jgi:competence protein ComEC